jgi:hypothetical protein
MKFDSSTSNIFISVSVENGSNYASTIYSISRINCRLLAVFIERKLKKSNPQVIIFEEGIGFALSGTKELIISEIPHHADYRFKKFKKSSYDEIKKLISFLLEDNKPCKIIVGESDSKVFCKIISVEKISNASCTNITYFATTLKEFLDIGNFYAELIADNIEVDFLNQKWIQCERSLTLKLNLSMLKHCNYEFLTLEAYLDPDHNQPYFTEFDYMELAKNLFS